MSKYLVTGGEGFIGSRILHATGGISYDIKSGSDILNKELLQEAVKDIDGIFHLAAKISVPESLFAQKEYYEANVEGTLCVIEVAESAGMKIVFSSSAAVYGEANVAVDEDSDLKPQSPYAENKRDAEDLLKKSTVAHIALRYFNVYGPKQSPEYAGVITSFIVNALEGKDLVIYGDGTQIRDFVFVDDVARANVLAMERNNQSFEVFNIGSGTETSIKELAETIIKLTGSESKIVYKPSRHGDIVYSKADVSKAKNVLGWNAETSLEEGLKQTISYYKNQWQKQ